MVWKGLFQSIAGLFGESLIDDIQEKVDTTLDNAKIHVESIVERVIKKLVIFFIVMLGLSFALA